MEVLQSPAILLPVMVGLYALAINGLTFSVFAVDKFRALNSEWRIRESTLLGLAFFGGSIGAKLAQGMLRHKTRKQPFRGLLNFIVFVQLFLILASLAWQFPIELPGPPRFETLIGDLGFGQDEEIKIAPKRFGPGS